MSSATPAARTPSILIVDDDEVLRSVLGFDFEMDGWQVHEAGNGEEALEILDREGSIEFVLSDVLMPKMGGVEMLKQILKKGTSHPAVVFITGYTALTLAEALDRGAEDLLFKPFERDALQATFKRLRIEPRDRWRGDLAPAIAASPRKTLQAMIPASSQAEDDSRFRLGRSGFFLSRGLAPGLRTEDLVDFSITAAGLELRGTGRVRWTRDILESPDLPPGSGIEFLRLDGGTLDAVLKFLEVQRPRASIPWR